MKNSSKRIEIPIQVSADQAWEVIGAVDGVDKWFPEVIKACRVEGNKRYCTTEEGSFSEDILKIDHENRTFKYGIKEQNLLPIRDIVATMQVHDGAETRISWEWHFLVDEEDESSVMDAFEGLGQMGVAGIERYAAELVTEF